ncbi:MAG TPA: PQQ-dependent sugar dehydrogenase, partial [Tepidisphaeraceae bacterium]|nr:PQQ-dependent sugar dehydrogenase [Tepidisphaeraceae bacterium]
MGWIRETILVAVIAALACCRALAGEPVECRWTEEKITIDGVADEGAWARAQLIENFQMGWKKEGERKPLRGTKARLLWDREYLYFFAEMEDGDLFADVTKHNGRIWDNDVFELFFKPAEDKPGYFEFEVNAANATLDQFFVRRESNGFGQLNEKYPFELKTAVKLRGTLNKRDDRDEGWSVEGRIPWKNFAPAGGRPGVGEIWKYAACRYDYDINGNEGKPELSSSASLSESKFHKYEDYALLKFVGPGDGKIQRVMWQNEHLQGTPEPPAAYAVKKRFEKLKIYQPIHVAVEPGTRNLIVTQHLGNWAGPGKIIRIKNEPDVSDKEILLDLDYLVYGLTFHPQFEKNGFVYLIANGPLSGGAKKMNRVFRYTMSREAPYRIDPTSQQVVIEWESDGHNGGELGFGADGMLYIPAGDGTSDSDVNLRGQDLRYLTSAMIRIDVDHPEAGKNYSVPKDNPFLNVAGARPEIWAYGFRNPWRMAFDRKTGQCWVGVNGQDLWEFVLLVQRGENYGWSLYEGSHEFRPNRKQGPTPITKPVIEHHHSEFRSLTG